jgi:hypothetical protein
MLHDGGTNAEENLLTSKTDAICSKMNAELAARRPV